MRASQEYLTSIMDAVSELDGRHTDPEAWDEYMAARDAARVVLEARRLVEA